jgi:glyoxylase-like metal-dependent hydrolase (beta-lactamase superfamily II)
LEKIAANIISLIASVSFAGIVLMACNQHLTKKENKSGEQIDSLIRTEKLNDKAIIIRFGGEAVTAINTQNGIVVIDAGISTGLTSRYRKLIEKEFQRNDFAYLIITHGHHDHYGGSSVFSDATIVAQENCVKAIAARWNDPDKVKSNLLKVINEYDKEMDTLKKGSTEWIDDYMLKTRFQCAYDDIMNNRPAEKPDMTFSDTLNIDMGDLTIHMTWFGKAHSDSDILIHVPKLKMLFTGDLFSKYGRPSIDDIKSLDDERCTKAIAWMEARMDKTDVIVGSHGQILSKEDLIAFQHKIKERND